MKKDAEGILSKLGIPMSTAIDMFLNQVVIVGGLPFFVTLTKPPIEIDGTQMTNEQIHEKLKKGYEDYKNGNVRDAEEVFEEFRENNY